MDEGSQLDDYRCTLRKLAVRDDRYMEALLQSDDRESAARAGIDPQAHALVRMGALIAVNAAPPAYMNAVEAALAAGASHEQIVGTLIAVLPLVGEARVVSAAPNLGLALGYDVGEALESVGREPV
jgi:4-carboxymuconolactone decarboxylase